jgi:hypothetical protein
MVAGVSFISTGVLAQSGMRGAEGKLGRREGIGLVFSAALRRAEVGIVARVLARCRLQDATASI